ncbi:hypothetical protein K439DRAFT_1639509 [Ramaria rubella]|nr:hypothetical protein K439DRAFT_1639509 [Ramaria rubella]
MPIDNPLCISSTSVREATNNPEPCRRTIPPAGTEYFEVALLHIDGQCDYVGSNGLRFKTATKQSKKPSDKKTKGSERNVKIANHWLNSHAVPEVIKLHKNTLDFENCVILKSAEMVSCLQCPINGCGYEFADISSFKWHIQTNIWPHARDRNED